MKAHPKPTKPEQCAVAAGFKKRSDAIYEMNILTRLHDEQHDIVKLSDGFWYVYNRVKFRP